MEQGRGMGARRFAPALWWMIAAAAGCGGDEGVANGCPPGMVASATGCQLAPANSGGSAPGGSGGAAGSAGSAEAARLRPVRPRWRADPGRAARAARRPPGRMRIRARPARPARRARPRPARRELQRRAAAAPPVRHPSARLAAATPTPPADGTKMLDVGGTQREFIVEIPDGYDANKAYKLIFAWHGLGGTGASIASRGFYGLSPRAMGTTIFVAGPGPEHLEPGGQRSGLGQHGRPRRGVHARDARLPAHELLHRQRAHLLHGHELRRHHVEHRRLRARRRLPRDRADGRLGPAAATASARSRRMITHGNQDTVVAYASGQRSRDYWVMSNIARRRPSRQARTVRRLSRLRRRPPGRLVRVHGRPHGAAASRAQTIWTFFSQF